MNAAERKQAEQDLRTAQEKETFDLRNGTDAQKVALEAKQKDERAALAAR